MNNGGRCAAPSSIVPTLLTVEARVGLFQKVAGQERRVHIGNSAGDGILQGHGQWSGVHGLIRIAIDIYRGEGALRACRREQSRIVAAQIKGFVL